MTADSTDGPGFDFVLVRSGHWLYDGTVPMPINIVGLDFDFWYDIVAEEGMLDEGEVPMEPGADGLIYYLRLQPVDEGSKLTWVDSPGYQTIDEVIEKATTKVPPPLEWH